MYQLEVNTYGSSEVFHFPTVEKVLDYIYMVEGETYLPEYRMEYQRKAPNTHDIEALKRSSMSFLLWEIATEDGPGAITYALSRIKISPKGKHFKWIFPKRSKFWGTVYGEAKGRVEKSADIAKSNGHYDDLYHMGVN